MAHPKYSVLLMEDSPSDAGLVEALLADGVDAELAGTVAAALQYRRETGCGAHIDASMYEICVQQMYIESRVEEENPT